MGRKSAAAKFDNLVQAAAKETSGIKQRKLIDKAKPLIGRVLTPNRQKGRPTSYSKALAKQICQEVANGKTLTRVADELGIKLDCVFEWLQTHEDFSDDYEKSRQSWAKVIVDRTIDQSEHIDPAEALAKKVRIGLVQWAAARYAPAQFSESKRIELKGQVDHRHVLELPHEQRRRIAEAWLVSSGQEETIVIPDETGRRPAIVHEPGDLEAAGISTVADGRDRIIPKRAKVADPAKRKKGGRKAKPNLDD